jgi:large conductance mechanosensitive channel
MALWNDFKQFAFKGNAVDLAVGVVIGAAFGKIVTAVVDDLIMPVVALVLPNGNWRQGGVVLKHGTQAIDPTTGFRPDDVILKYGNLLGVILDFLIVAFVLFLIVSKVVKAAEKRLAGKPAAATTRECPYCLETIPVKARRCKACASEVDVATA